LCLAICSKYSWPSAAVLVPSPWNKQCFN
jgi:hypothetical protein